MCGLGLGLGLMATWSSRDVAITLLLPKKSTSYLHMVSAKTHSHRVTSKKPRDTDKFFFHRRIFS